MIHTRRARVGIVGMGHFVYWPQFDGLVDELKQKQKIDAKYFRECEVVDLGFADDIDSSIVCLKKALAADLDALIEIFETADGSYASDGDIMSIIYEEAQYYFDGAKPLDEVLGLIGSRVGLKLSE